MDQRLKSQQKSVLNFVLRPDTALSQQMMKTVPLRQISPTKGYSLELSAGDDWLIDIFKNVLPDETIEPQSIKGQIKFYRTNEFVDIIGNIEFSHNPSCSHCGNDLKAHEKISFQVHQAPLEKDRHRKDEDEDEVELEKEDLHFGFYENEEIRVDTIINDEIALELPLNYYCTDSNQCKIDLPQNPHISLHQSPDKSIDPRWLPLKNLKKTSK